MKYLAAIKQNAPWFVLLSATVFISAALLFSAIGFIWKLI